MSQITNRAAGRLSDWFETGRYRQTELNRLAGITHLSRIKNGDASLTSETLEKILPFLELEDQIDLLYDFLCDQRPDDFSYLVDIVRRPTPAPRVSSPAENSPLSLEQALDLIGNAAPSMPNLRRMVVNLGEMIRDRNTVDTE